MLAVLLAALLLPAARDELRPQLALAEQKKPAKPAPRPAAKPPPADDDFDLLPQEARPDAAAQAKLEKDLETRRTMLHYHQLAGITMLASMATTVVLGQLNYNDKYAGHGDVGTYHDIHLAMGFITAGLFAGTAALSVFAPVPIEKKVRWDTATIHKTAMTVAAAGMVTQIILGIVTASQEGSGTQRDYAKAHQIVGYVTLAATFTGFLVLTF